MAPNNQKGQEGEVPPVLGLTPQELDYRQGGFYGLLGEWLGLGHVGSPRQQLCAGLCEVSHGPSCQYGLTDQPCMQRGTCAHTQARTYTNCGTYNRQANPILPGRVTDCQLPYL